MTQTFPWPTIGGYDYYEVISALQKSIRRGLEPDALFWATELYLSNYAVHAWSRFRIIASEDIGPAANSVCLIIDTLHRTWQERTKDKKNPCDDAKLYFIHAVLVLVRSPKSRTVDDCLHVSFNDRTHRDIPDYALDRHTTRGKLKGRGYEHFFSEGTKLANETIPNPYTDRVKELFK